MVLKPPVRAGAPFKVRYTADIRSAGTTLLILGWVPKHGHAVPPPDERTIAPGMAQEIADTVPAFAAARRLEIRVDLPDGTGSGELELFVDDKPHSAAILTADTIWTSLVDT
jgi:hypothetical protein